MTEDDPGKKGSHEDTQWGETQRSWGARPLTRGGGAPPSLCPKDSGAGTDTAGVGDDGDDREVLT